MLAGIGLATKGIIAKLLFAEGVSVGAVVSVRAMLAVPGFLLVAVLFGARESLRNAPLSAWAYASIAGFVCYYVGAELNFLALSMIDAGIERALLFSYPTLVVLVTSFNSRSLPGRRVAMATAITWAGIALVVGLTDRNLLAQNLFGAGLVILCAATMAFFLLVTERVTRSINGPAFTAIAMTTAGICFGVRFLLTVDTSGLVDNPKAWYLMATLIVFATVLPLVAMAEGVRRIGAQRGAIVSTVGPPATIIFAAWLLGERMTSTQIVGVILIIAGIVILELRGRAIVTTTDI